MCTLPSLHLPDFHEIFIIICYIDNVCWVAFITLTYIRTGFWKWRRVIATQSCLWHCVNTVWKIVWGSLYYEDQSEIYWLPLQVKWMCGNNVLPVHSIDECSPPVISVSQTIGAEEAISTWWSIIIHVHFCNKWVINAHSRPGMGYCLMLIYTWELEIGNKGG